ncbi:hypothetical protein [Pseudomonas aeruginosa]|uniref:hypothetical protein n=1 Tax=Pseudomonas aeruginosa TaxID=287 RepID=UPI002F42B35E
MNDRELLELAARAAGYVVRWHDDTLTHGPAFTIEDPENPYVFKIWNPLTDDGDALRLAVKLGFLVDICRDHTCVCSETADPILQVQGKERWEATRRAIVRAAAEIGKSMGGGE